MTCGAWPDVPAPSLGGQGVRGPAGDLGFPMLETVSLAAPTEQSCMRDMAEEQHHPSKSPTNPGKDQFPVSQMDSCSWQGFPISHFIQPEKLSNPAWGSGGAQRGSCCITWGSCSLFPPSVAAKIHQFFPSFPRDVSSVSTETSVPWACARLFAGTKRSLCDATRVGMATNDLLFPSGKVERRVTERWRRLVACPPCLGSRGMWQCKCLALESASCM